MTGGCYTCRRRRIVCDNGLPTCRKCRDAGRECLGYKKPLVWVKGGVASRGKMMGRSFESGSKIVSNGNGDGESRRALSTSDNSSNIPSLELEPGRYWTYPVSLSSGNRIDEGSRSIAEDLPSPWGLVDPLLQDLKPLSRFYLYHYNQHMVGTLALYPGIRNPYRDLTSLVGDSPVLAYALTAAGALHYALLYHRGLSPAPWSLQGPTAARLPLKEFERIVANYMTQRPASKEYEHFLAFKQRALGQLLLDVCDSSKKNDDRTVAAIMILALLDVTESGGGAWKYHLEGAKNLLKYREYGCHNGHAQDIMRSTFSIDECLMFQLMGSTLSRPGILSKPFFSSSMGPAVFKRLELTSFVGCPAYLLDVIFFVHSQWYQDTVPVIESRSATVPIVSVQPEPFVAIQSTATVLQHIQAFNPAAWAQEMQSGVYLHDLAPRITLATIYKAAVYLYASRVLSRPPPRATHSAAVAQGKYRPILPPKRRAIVDALVHQLSLIPHADPHFKSLVWPTFIAGAESTCAAHRPEILQLLFKLFYVITAANVCNEAWVLSLMWRKQDLKREKTAACSQDDDDFDWIQELEDLRIDWLFI